MFGLQRISGIWRVTKTRAADQWEQMTTQSQHSRRPSIGQWIGRHRGSIVWTAVLTLLLSVQWPMLKGVFYRATGATAPPDGIPWRTDFAAAVAESKQTGKPVLLDFTASWCPPCQAMKHDTWPDAKVREVLTDKYIPVKVDVDTAVNGELSSRYAVSSIPSIVVVDADGKVLKRGSFMSPRSMIGFLTADAT